MSKIAEQIKLLQLKQKKIDYISYVADLIKNDKKCIDFKDVQEEVVSKIEPFLLNLMESIEKDSDIKNESKSSGMFDADEYDALKLLASKVKSKSGSDVSQAPRQPQPKQPEVANHDKMNFALNHRHLGNKRVQVLNDQNATILGTVVGLDAPFVVVKTDTGPTINVPINMVVLQ